MVEKCLVLAEHLLLQPLVFPHHPIMLPHGEVAGTGGLLTARPQLLLGVAHGDVSLGVGLAVGQLAEANPDGASLLIGVGALSVSHSVVTVGRGLCRRRTAGPSGAARPGHGDGAGGVPWPAAGVATDGLGVGLPQQRHRQEC